MIEPIDLLEISSVPLLFDLAALQLHFILESGLATYLDGEKSADDGDGELHV